MRLASMHKIFPKEKAKTLADPGALLKLKKFSFLLKQTNFAAGFYFSLKKRGALMSLC
jgi:hypothetical protein